MWSEFYRDPTQLRTEEGQRRIFAPASYRRVREASLVPIVLREAITLAAWFPICWRQGATVPELVALRSLLPKGLAIPQDALRNPSSMPLTLHAYPVAIGPRHGIDSGLIVDAEFADAPTDAGSPLLNLDGTPTKAALQRIVIAAAMQQELEMRLEIAEAFLEAGAFEPWPLHFELSATMRTDHDDLLVLSAEKLRQGCAYAMLRRYGANLGRFIVAQRISLYRIGTLLAAARNYARAQDEAAQMRQESLAMQTKAAEIGVKL